MNETENISTELSCPKGETQIDWAPVQLNGAMRILCLQDLHIPFHDYDSLTLAVKTGQDFRADTVILNGDTCDFYQLSRWDKDPRLPRFNIELKIQIQFLRWLRAQFPKARIIFKLGNHEERYEIFMQGKAPELIGVDQFTYQSILQLDNFGIELVRDKRPIRAGNLNIIHGHEYRFAISNPVNPARGLFLRAKAYAICGHFHQSSYHSEKNIEDNIIATWSVGCLCDMHPPYLPLNNWAQGFALIEVTTDNKFTVINRVIRHGKLY